VPSNNKICMINNFVENREVTKTIKNQYGDVVALCNDAELWSPKLKSIAVPEIELKVHRYFVKYKNLEVDIVVLIDGNHGKYISTKPSVINKNLLLELPDSY